MERTLHDTCFLARSNLIENRFSMRVYKPAISPGDLRFLRRTAACAWVAGFLAMILAWGQNRFGVLHPWSFTFIALLAATFAIGLLACFLPQLWRLLRSSSRGCALAWLIAGLIPSALW